MSTEQAIATRNAEQLAKAQEAFASLANLGTQPALECDGYPNHGQIAEFSVALNPSPMTGVLHEDIEEALKIASATGGRLWLCPSDGKLSIVWPLPKGPDGSGSPAEAGRRAAHGVEGGDS